MSVVGGIVPLNDNPLPTWTTQGCNNGTIFAQGLGMFSLNNHSWSSTYDPVTGLKPYSIHPSIFKVIGGNESGGATSKEPIGGFDQKDLRTLLAPSTASNDTSAHSITPVAPTHSSGRKMFSDGAIAGIVGSIISSLMLSLAIGFTLCLRRRQKLRTPGAAEMSGQIARSELSAYKTRPGSDTHLTPAELSDTKDEKVHIRRSEIGDVRD